MNRPNIILFLTDQLRQDALGCYGNAICETPNLDRLAGEGTAFDFAYTTSPVCSPARASLLTGRYPHNHGVMINTHIARGVVPGPVSGHPHLLRSAAGRRLRPGLRRQVARAPGAGARAVRLPPARHTEGGAAGEAGDDAVHRLPGWPTAGMRGARRAQGAVLLVALHRSGHRIHPRAGGRRGAVLPAHRLPGSPLRQRRAGAVCFTVRSG